MKIKFLSIALMSTLFFAACSGESKEPAAEPEAPAADAAPATLAVAAATYTVDAATSSIAWKGEVAGVYGHEGTLAVASGTLDTDGSTVTGGVIEIDMTSLKANVDESFPQGKADKLQGHLGSADFFNTSEFATATFKITSANGTPLLAT
ncbi:MAG: YceI family protein [Flavobacteriales bacterium]|nr:YceI family protein [Flavobacteriales bacterium]